MFCARILAGAATLSVLALAPPGRAQQPPATAQATGTSTTMDQMMRACAKMRDDMAHRRPMGPNGMKLMEDCQRMEQQMGSTPAPAATLDR